MSLAANDPSAPLWQTLRDFIAQAFSLFGAPHEIAQQGVRLREEHGLFLRYLRQCETLLRKLLFIDALALAPSLPSRPPAESRQKPLRARRLHTQSPDNSETWRVTFSVSGHTPFDTPSRAAKAAQGSAIFKRGSSPSLPEPREARVEGKATGSAARFTSTWPAAERFEAPIRAFNDPAPYVKRLARLIKRNAQLPRLFARVPARAYGQSVLEEEIRDASLIIRERRKAPDSS